MNEQKVLGEVMGESKPLAPKPKLDSQVKTLINKGLVKPQDAEEALTEDTKPKLLLEG